MSTEPPRRLRYYQRDEMVEAILADLAAHGPSLFSVINRRLTGVMGEHFVQRTLRGLVEAGRITAKVQPFTWVGHYMGEPRMFRYRATVYALTAKPKGKRPR